MSVSSSSIEDEGAKKMKRRSSFAPGRRSLITNVVSASESDADEESGDSLTEDKMLTGLIHELISEHKQEQTDWNNFIRKEKKETEEYLNEPDILLKFAAGEEPELLSSKYRDAISKSNEVVEREREALKKLRERVSDAESQMEKLVETAERRTAEIQRRVDKTLQQNREKKAVEGNLRGDVEILLMSDDSGIGTECTSNSNTLKS